MFYKNYKKKNKTAFSLIELSIVIIIIGLLVGGLVFTAGKMVSLSRLTNARTMTNSAPISSIEDLVLWVEATDKESFDSGDRVDQNPANTWYDINPQLANKKTMTQSAGDRPLYTESGISNLPSLSFDGTDDNFAINADLHNIGSGESTLFVVAQSDVSTAQTIFATEDGVASQYGLRYDGTNIEFMNDESSTALAQSAVTLTDAHIYTAYRSGTNQTIVVDGTTSVTDASASDVLTSNGGSIGELNIASPTERFDGFIGEVILYDRALSAFERGEIEEYLSKKWKIDLD